MAVKKTKPTEEAQKAPQATKDEKAMAKKLETPVNIPGWSPNPSMAKIVEYVDKRINEMIDFRSNLGIEQRWREADEEYVPHELDFGTTRKRFETDQDTGLRSRLVPVGDATQQWRSASSAPTLLAKIQTALSLIIDNQPEADLVALVKKYQATSALAYSLWKRNWSITDAKEKLKLFIFDLFKYGWAVQRTYPRLVSYDKRVLKTIDTENPENNTYIDIQLEQFNDIDRENLDVFRTWIDETTKPYDRFSMKDDYYEVDYSYDQFMVEFGSYPNAEYVKPDSLFTRAQQAGKTNRQQVGRASTNTDNKMRKDIVTVGFFESRLKDLFVIYIPKDKIVVYQSPLPNDDGLLSVSHSMYIIRNSKLPYGVSLWEIIRQNKQLYDKMKNMGMDQLVLSIMKFGFFSGTNTALGDGKMEIVPGQARQITTSSGSAKDAVNWMEIPGPGADFWKGIEAIAAMMDDESGISPTLEGEITGKTLGEILNAKEAALKRLKTPVQNIAWAIEQDAYLTLSWMSQTYSIPVIKNFENIQEMLEYEKEEMVNHEQLFAEKDPDPEKGYVNIQATYLPQLSLHLEDKDGELQQGKESKFYQLGEGKGKISVKKIKWQGIFKIIPRSIIDSSEELIKASKMELFNIIVPLLQNPPELVAKALKEVLDANEEDYHDWLPDAFVQFLDQGPQAATVAPGSAGIATPSAGGAPAVATGQSMQANAGTGANVGASTVLPASQLKSGQKGGLFNAKI